MMIGAIPVEWAMFFTGVVGLGALFFLVRAIVFVLCSEGIVWKLWG